MQSLSENGSPLRIDAVLTGLSSEYARRLGDLLRGVLNGILTRTMSFPLSEQRTAVDGARGRPIEVRRIGSDALPASARRGRNAACLQACPPSANP